jgi:hypothetical protein
MFTENDLKQKQSTPFSDCGSGALTLRSMCLTGQELIWGELKYVLALSTKLDANNAWLIVKIFNRQYGSGTIPAGLPGQSKHCQPLCNHGGSHLNIVSWCLQSIFTCHQTFSNAGQVLSHSHQ